MKPRFSNCNIEALEQLRSGKAIRLCMQFTKFSRITWTHTWWWSPLRLLGGGLQMIAWNLLHISEVLRSGRWFHMIYETPDGDLWEYVPDEVKKKRMIPPFLFRGSDRRVADERRSNWTGTDRREDNGRRAIDPPPEIPTPGADSLL